MGALRLASRDRYRTVESALAVSVILVGAVLLAEPEVVFGESTVAASDWVPAAVLLPGLLALLVLADVLTLGVRLVSAHFGTGDRAPPEEMTLPRIVASIVLGTVSTYTLGWVVGSVYVVYFADSGGVHLVPLLTFVVGSALGVLVLIEPPLYRWFDGG